MDQVKWDRASSIMDWKGHTFVFYKFIHIKIKLINIQSLKQEENVFFLKILKYRYSSIKWSSEYSLYWMMRKVADNLFLTKFDLSDSSR